MGFAGLLDPLPIIPNMTLLSFTTNSNILKYHAQIKQVPGKISPGYFASVKYINFNIILGYKPFFMQLAQVKNIRNIRRHTVGLRRPSIQEAS